MNNIDTGAASTDASNPLFSVIIPTRNRVEMFQQALDSVLAQSFERFEVIVVNDGSIDDTLARYKVLANSYPQVDFHYLVHRPNGHGQSYSMNFGASQARGEYLCFLDDDDYWTDNKHLSKAARALKRHKADAYYSNQEGWFVDGSKHEQPLWIADLTAKLDPQAADEDGVFPLNADALLQAQGFAHLNCTIVRRSLYLDIGGMDENIRYECDHDIYLRVIDAARGILYNPAVISYHRIPDNKKATNMSTALSTLQKRLYQLTVFEKGILFSRQTVVRQYCLQGKGHQLKFIASTLENDGNRALAAYYAQQALAAQPTFKWRIKALLLRLQKLLGH